MRVVVLSEEKECARFACEATAHFDTHPTHYTYAEGDPKAGQLMAIRWNSFTVLVLRLHDDFEPLCYPTHQLIGHDLPKMEVAP